MGMDISGQFPTTKEGEYFRNNVWWWRPLANYACGVAPEITSGCKYWQSNDGDGLGSADAVRLADALQAEIDAGRTKQYADAYLAKISKIPRPECNLCRGTGIRTDHIGLELGMTTRVIAEDQKGHPRRGQTGWCNGCDGIGNRTPDEGHYPFSVENVQEFVTFLRGCGGFEIW